MMIIKLGIFFAVLMVTASQAQDLPPHLYDLQESTTTRIRDLGDHTNRTLQEMHKDLDLHFVELVRALVVYGHEHLVHVKKFRKDYLDRASAAIPRAPGKSIPGSPAEPESPSAPGEAATPPPLRPNDECVESAGPVLRRVNDAERVLTHCVMKYILKADKIIDDVNHEEREFFHKFDEIRQRIRPCVTLYAGTPGAEQSINDCLNRVMESGNILFKEVIPKINENGQKLLDYATHPETTIEHCAKTIEMEYFNINQRHELHFHFDNCARSLG